MQTLRNLIPAGKPEEIFRSNSSGPSTASPIELVKAYEAQRATVSQTVCKTKAHALQVMQEQGQLPNPGRRVGNKFIEFFQLIGADKQLPTESDERRGYIMRYHAYLCLLNPVFPSNLPVSFVYEQFFTDVILDKVPMKGYNVRELVRCFGEWWRSEQPGVYARFYHQHPEARPKQLVARTELSLKAKIEAQKITVQQLIEMEASSTVIQKEQERLTQYEQEYHESHDC